MLTRLAACTAVLALATSGCATDTSGSSAARTPAPSSDPSADAFASCLLRTGELAENYVRAYLDDSTTAYVEGVKREYGLESPEWRVVLRVAGDQDLTGRLVARGRQGYDEDAVRLVLRHANEECQAEYGTGVDASPSAASVPPTDTLPSAAAVPDLSLGCEAIIVRVAPQLLRDPNAVLQGMAATYGRAGDQVIDAAFNYTDDPRLDTDPEAVAREACSGTVPDSVN